MQGPLELIEFLDLQAQGAALQAQRLSHLDQTGQRGALERQREAPAQGDEIGLETVIRGDHRQAGQAALGRLALQHHGQVTAETEVQRPAFGVEATRG